MKPGAGSVPLCCVHARTHMRVTQQHACTVARAAEQPTGRCFDSWEALMPPCLQFISLPANQRPPSNATVSTERTRLFDSLNFCFSYRQFLYLRDATRYGPKARRSSVFFVFNARGLGVEPLFLRPRVLLPILGILA